MEVLVALVVHLIERREVRVDESEHDGPRGRRRGKRGRCVREAQRSGALIALNSMGSAEDTDRTIPHPEEPRHIP